MDHTERIRSCDRPYELGLAPDAEAAEVGLGHLHDSKDNRLDVVVAVAVVDMAGEVEVGEVLGLRSFWHLSVAHCNKPVTIKSTRMTKIARRSSVEQLYDCQRMLNCKAIRPCLCHTW